MAPAYPAGVLLCRPAHFDVIDVKNPFMQTAVPVDRGRAMQQWAALRTAFESAGLAPFEVQPLRGAEDMVFTANPAFTGLDLDGTRVAVAGRMRFASRAPEVAPSVRRLADLGYRIDLSVPPQVLFEGGGDAIWHPSVHRIYLGYGWRSDVRAAQHLQRAFRADVVPLRLVDERFYHLDTALCAIDATTALVVPAAFDAAGRRVLETHFERLIELDESEALAMGANATSNWRGTVIVDRGAAGTIRQLRAAGQEVLPVDTSEFRKSGGSVYCMKQYLF